ncbi:hypothetical protein V6N13_020893 [Hibiscus sabdariffa]
MWAFPNATALAWLARVPPAYHGETRFLLNTVSNPKSSWKQLQGVPSHIEQRNGTGLEVLGRKLCTIMGGCEPDANATAMMFARPLGVKLKSVGLRTGLHQLNSRDPGLASICYIVHFATT